MSSTHNLLLGYSTKPINATKAQIQFVLVQHIHLLSMSSMAMLSSSSNIMLCYGLMLNVTSASIQKIVLENYRTSQAISILLWFLTS